jgi:hypothetical protein
MAGQRDGRDFAVGTRLDAAKARIKAPAFREINSLAISANFLELALPVTAGLAKKECFISSRNWPK